MKVEIACSCCAMSSECVRRSRGSSPPSGWRASVVKAGSRGSSQRRRATTSDDHDVKHGCRPNRSARLTAATAMSTARTGEGRSSQPGCFVPIACARFCRSNALGTVVTRQGHLGGGHRHPPPDGSARTVASVSVLRRLRRLDERVLPTSGRRTRLPSPSCGGLPGAGRHPRRTSWRPHFADSSPTSPPASSAGGTYEPLLSRHTGPLERTSARKADSGTLGGGGAGTILKKIQAWLSIRRQGVRRR